MTARGTAARFAWMVLACLAGGAGSLAAQVLPSEPIAFADGRVTVGGDVSASIGSSDPGFFNYTDYEHSALRLLRVDVSAAVRLSPHFALLGEIRTENLGGVRPYAFYLRIRPWTARNIDIQIGRVPPTFGAFARRTYANDNPLIGYPLAYQYLTSLRNDALPASADELLRKRSLGWLVRYSLGEPGAAPGVPLVTAFRWDTGVQAHVTAGMVTATAALTRGSLSNPLFNDDNGGDQVAGRIELRPVAGLIAGASFARGAFVDDDAARAALGIGHERNFAQTAWGADLEYSRDHYVVRMETIVSDWTIPMAAMPALAMPLRAVATTVEGRYKIRPGLYAAARYDHLGFSTITSATDTLPWEAPVERVEVGGGYSILRNLLLKVSFQIDRRDGGVLRRSAQMAAAQLVFWF
jgi:hypothetical protein